MPIREKAAAHALAATLALVSRIVREATPARSGFALVDAHELAQLGVALERYRDAIKKEPARDEGEGHE